MSTKAQKSYDEFVGNKAREAKSHGFEPVVPLNEKLFDWQRLIVTWAVRQGRCALFEDCGLGKTLQQLEWARQVEEFTKRPVMILCPLAVASQTVHEAEKFGFPKVSHVREPEQIGSRGIYITNYERLELFLPVVGRLSGIVLDESSILKSFTGKTRTLLTEAFSNTPYRICCTATPAPNDFMEFGQHCEFLGVMPSNEMLSRWFINDTMNFGTYRLKGHARQDFWRWVSTWAACVGKPSDLGFSDEGYNLPPLEMSVVSVKVDASEGAEAGELFRNPALNATNLHKEMRLTCENRVKAAAEIVKKSDEAFVIWCNTNYEADELVKALPDAIEVRGSDKPEVKERKLDDFTDAKGRVIITKPSIAGYGLNWQHCRNHIFVGLSYSFEDFYQAMRRGYRFGQKREFRCFIIQAETESETLNTIKRKMAQHEEMQREMKFAAKHLRNEQDKALTMKTDIEKQSGNGWEVYNGDCVRVISTLPDNCIDFTVYSPPFANLYIYSADAQDMGNCAGNDEFIEQYRFLVREKLRTTKPGCLSAVHCKNLVKYAGRDGAAGLTDFRGQIIRLHEEEGWVYHSEFVIWKDPVIEMQRTKAQGLLFKQLNQDSRYSRAGMPEYVIMFRKWADGMDENPVSHNAKNADWNYIGDGPPTNYTDERHRNIQIWQRYASPVWMDIQQTRVLNGEIARENQDEKHICPLQLDVIERLIWLYTNKGDTVFSPFTGIGSEGFCAVKMGRRFIGSELKSAYWKIAIDHLKKAEEESRDLFTS